MKKLVKLVTAYRTTFGGRWNKQRLIHNSTCMERFCKRFPNIKDISHEALAGYVADRQTISKRGTIRSDATINRELAELNRVLNWGVITKKINCNPMKGFGLLKEPKHRERILSPDEMRRIFKTVEAFDSDFRLIVKIALRLGLRFGEIVSLKWIHVDELNKQLILLNTKHGHRKIPVPDDLWYELKRLEKRSEWVFPSPNDPESHLKSVRHPFARLLKESGIKSLHFHDLRHTAATYMLKNGADIKTVQEILGHADVKTTMRYLNPLEETKRSALEWTKAEGL